jgi:chemotaxis signal transduction protein/ABC-type nitrate/sulfonate/bicarbonate transport system substrate-binding protein
MPVDSSLKILLVEDAATMRKMEARILNQIGFTAIVEAADGEAALALLETEEGISLIISDWAMPNLDGYELLQRVRADGRFAAIPFLMATCHGDKEYVAKAMAGGASGVVAKPFTPDELRILVDEVFGAAPRQAAPQEQTPRVSAEGRVRLRMAHIQITDHLALGVLRHQVRSEGLQPRRFDLETMCLPGWNPVQKALEQGEVDGAFILAPAAMDLFSYGVDIRLVLFAHRNGSICVRSKAEKYVKPYQQFFKHKTFLVPHKMSIHNMLGHMYFTRMGLRPGVAGSEAVNVLFDVVPPVGMPEFLAQNADTSGFMVAEPIGSRAVAAGIAERQFLSSEIWADHPCCVVVFRREFIDSCPEAVQEFTEMLVAAGRSIREDIPRSAAIAVDFLDPQQKLGLSADLLQSVLSDPQGIRTDDLYPSVADLETIQSYMQDEMGIGRRIDLGRFVDPRFADVACKGRGGKVEKRGPDLAGLAEDKALTGREGKYLVFDLGRERYGIGILDVREIVGLSEINRVPGMPACYRGVIKLRERVIPVLDMRSKVGQQEIEYNDRTCIIIVEVSGRKGSTLQGVIVDAVSEVAMIKEEQVEDAPAFGEVDTSCILGMAKLSNGVVILLDIDRLLHASETVALAGVA